ncbi:MAG: hypothetical protein AAF757_20420, partial [Cyanobacteria bacterium P01_D01_bin.116]
ISGYCYATSRLNSKKFKQIFGVGRNPASTAARKSKVRSKKSYRIRISFLTAMVAKFPTYCTSMRDFQPIIRSS